MESKVHFLFLVRHGERADQKETKVAFRNSNLPPHDPPLRSTFLKEVNDPALDRCCEIIGEYLRIGIPLFSSVLSEKPGSPRLEPEKFFEPLVPSLLVTSPLQRCVGTAHYIANRLPSTDTHKEGLRYHCNVRLYEYLCEGLFTVPKAPLTGKISKQSSAITTDDAEAGNVSETVSRDVSEVLDSPTGELVECKCPIPYAYNSAGPHAERCLYVHPTDAATSLSCPASDPSPFGSEDLQFIHSRYPESRQAAEKRFEEFVDEFIRSAESNVPSTSSDSSPLCSIVCTHQFGVLAMVSHLLRNYLNKDALGRTAGGEIFGEEIKKTCPWREYVKAVWSQKAYEAAQHLSLKISPQFTPRIDTGAVSLIVIQSSKEGIKCTPITVGET